MNKPSRVLSGLVLVACLAVVANQTFAQANAPTEDAPAPSQPAPAQPAPSQPPPTGPRLTPPSIFQFVEAPFPQAAIDAGVEGATVELEILIDPDGFVVEAKVVTPVGHGFDEAALDVIRRFMFNPAMRDEEPIPARIRYNYVFEMRAVEAPEPEGPVPGALEGQVLNADTNQGVAAAEIVISNADASFSRRAVTDAEGKFAFAELPPDTYSVRVFGEQLGDQDYQEEVRESEATSVTYRLKAQEVVDPDAYSATARIRPPPREVTRRTIEREQLTRIAGTRGDALRTVELLAGVGRPPFGAGAIIVRGSSPQDSQAFFEGLPVQQIYHFGGLTSFVNSNFLQRIEFYPGNFGSQFGRKRGGVIEVAAAGPRTSHAHGNETHDYNLHSILDANLIDLSFFVEGPISKDVSYMAAGRRSIIDTYLGSVLPDDVRAIALPVYYDYQAMVTARLSDRDNVRLMAFGSGDRFALVLPDGDDPNLQGNFDLQSSFHRVQATWSRRLTDAVDQDINLAVSPTSFGVGVGNLFKFDLTGTQLLGRAEWRARLTSNVRLIAGLDYQQFPGTFSYRGPAPQIQDGGSGTQTIDSTDIVESGYDFNTVYPGFYLESDFNFQPVRVVISTRSDFYSDIGKWSFDPRIVALYTVEEGTVLKAGAGIYSQPPQPPYNLKQIGNPDLTPMRTVHLSVGAERDFSEALNVQADLYYKQLFDDVIGSTNGVPPFFVNNGLGRIYGMELQAKLQPVGRIFGYFSYTLSRSERYTPQDGWRVYDFDQTHILTASAGYRLGRGWEIGGTFRYVTGNPNTPVTLGILDPDTGQHAPLFGPPNSIRNDAFHRLDVRIAKEWTFSNDAKLTVYLDIQNAYNRANQEGLAYNFDYTQQQTVSGLPIIPSLGLKLDSFL